MTEEMQEPIQGIVTTHSEVIDGIPYTTETLPATEGLVILPKLIRLVGQEGMTLMMATSKEELDALTKNPEVMAAMITAMADKAAETDGLLIVKRLLQKTVSDKCRIGQAQAKANVMEHFDTHFAGRYTHLLNVCMWVARCSFGGP